MSVYSVKGKGWRFDFTLKGERYTGAWFKTKREAKQAEAERRKEARERTSAPQAEQTPTDTGFLELVNRRLDHVRAYNSPQHYAVLCSLARRWVQRWDGLTCGQITQEMVEDFVLERSRVSAYTANREIQSLRATFNFARKRKNPWIKDNPVEGIAFLPLEKRRKYVPPLEDIFKVISLADPDTQDYLWTIRETMGRSIEINRMTWEDVDLRNRTITLYTRKKKGGHLTPRTIPMTKRLHDLMSRRQARRDPSKPWLFWHTYWSSKTGEKKTGPYRERKRIMKTLCKKAGVRYFRFHALRHCGASIMDRHNVPLGSIQRILGHESRETTESYLHSIGQAEREAMSVFEEISEKSHTESHTAGERKLSLVK